MPDGPTAYNMHLQNCNVKIHQKHVIIAAVLLLTVEGNDEQLRM